MLTQWIPAPQALTLLDELSDASGFRRVLLSRARSGALKARARLLHIEGDVRHVVDLKAAFWDWDRYTESEERWEVGDFSATIDGLRHDAIGVTFDLAALLEMLPLEQRPKFARRVSVAGNAGWVEAKAARAFMYDELNANPMKAGQLLLDQCRLGFVAARAVVCRQAEADNPNQWSIEEREWDIPMWFWESFTGAENSAQDWERGVFSGKGKAPTGSCYITLSGVHFSRQSLDAMLPAIDARTEANVKVGIGRPPAAFWDELWCAIFGKIFRGELIPVRQADIEKAMLGWASDNDHDLSETAAKLRARKLFTEYQAEGKNSTE